MNSTNDYIKKKWGERSQIELAKAIAKIIADERGKECGEKDYELYKGYVNKWFKTDQEPGKDYLVRLSKILNVSVESILMGEDVVCDYGDRATAYSAAKSGNPNIIEKLFGNYEADIQLHTTDEYEKVGTVDNGTIWMALVSLLLFAGCVYKIKRRKVVSF